MSRGTSVTVERNYYDEITDKEFELKIEIECSRFYENDDADGRRGQWITYQDIGDVEYTEILTDRTKKVWVWEELYKIDKELTDRIDAFVGKQEIAEGEYPEPNCDRGDE